MVCWCFFPLASGGAASASSLLFVYSLDYARTHLANDAKATKKGGERQFNGLVDGSLSMNEGAKSLFKGASANILHVVAGAGVLVGYDNLQLIMFWKKCGFNGA
ncbi:ADP,ATP carrier protein 1, mitochondrial-like [Ziziphus jujuba]|uniref:ADP/ATP translocase n=1 Tax=Ziziphus jujuba TaxID=326968 RepID=A0ABM3ZRR4_ZIZJJ|nr:ADP,ATP carrier protein 1, mitochondrial-like [Ziziphus jujuba]